MSNFNFTQRSFSSIYLIDIYGVKGANMAHFVNYVLYFLVILIVFYKALFGKIENE